MQGVKTLFPSWKEPIGVMAQSQPVSIFCTKYMEFADDLSGALPELEAHIQAAKTLSDAEKLSAFQSKVLPNCGPLRDQMTCPGEVLPGVVISDALWTSLSHTSQRAIQEHLTLLSFCVHYESIQGDSDGPALNQFTETFLKSWKDQMNKVDFESMSKKLAGMFGNLTPDSLPKIPERLLKGHIARLCEELVKEFKPDDFGLTAEQLAECDKDPMSAFKLLTDIYTNKPEVLQKAIQRIASRLQDKVKRGEIRPDQIAAEAEELMKEFSSNTNFKQLMESLRSTFGMEDPDLAREVGREGDARRNLVKERLRKKLDARKGGKK